MCSLAWMQWGGGGGFLLHSVGRGHGFSPSRISKPHRALLKHCESPSPRTNRTDSFGALPSLYWGWRTGTSCWLKASPEGRTHSEWHPRLKPRLLMLRPAVLRERKVVPPQSLHLQWTKSRWRMQSTLVTLQLGWSKAEQLLLLLP